MRILGISPLDKDSTVSFVEDGKVVFACGEERLSRTKQQSGFPSRALELGLTFTGWQLSDLDAVAYAFFDGKEEARLIHESAEASRQVDSKPSLNSSAEKYRLAKSAHATSTPSGLIPGLKNPRDEFVAAKPWWKRFAYERAADNPTLGQRVHAYYYRDWIKTAVREHAKWSNLLEQELTKLGLHEKLHRYHHHDTHAANAIFASGFDDALVMALDGYGSGCCGGIYTAGDDGIQNVHRYAFPYSLGIFYEQVTSALGFRPSRHEGKIVGLASYGDPAILADVLLSRFDLADGDIKIHSAQNVLLGRALSGHFRKQDIAAAYQFALEKVATESLAYWLKKTGRTRLVVSGGVHANVKLNQRLFEVDGVEEIFVYPNMGDGGCATGAALLAARELGGSGTAVDNVYYGPEFTSAQIEAALSKEQLTFERLDSIESRIAELLANNHIVARFSGRMEYGPRALGNRSILYHAREPEVNQWLNQQLGRTEFMPFAPACLAAHAPKLFKGMEGCEKTSQFMTITFDCTDQMIQHSPAAVHVDGTARPQLVTNESNPSFHRVLTNYHELTGIPVLINTSFNMHEEPIVCSPDDAVRAFLLGNLDYLAIGEYLVGHPELENNLRQRAVSGQQSDAALV